jgi:hypothetical protein
MQGGSTKSKLGEGEVPYESWNEFYQHQREEREAYRAQAAADTGQCWAFGNADDRGDEVDRHNEKIIQLIDTLGKFGAGKRAILKAVAEKQGIVDEDELERLYEGKSEHKLRLPPSLHRALQQIGLGDRLAETNILTTNDPIALFPVDATEWEDIEFEVALDSGAVVHVCAPNDIPGYLVQESAGSRRGQEFLMGDGGTIPNLGESSLNLADEGKDLQSVFQIAAVTRPLMSVGRICDQGHSITFNALMAVVHAADGTELCKFQRQPGGLYVAKLKLRKPTPFGRQE